MIGKTLLKQILLASNSPRRKELLSTLGVEFRVVALPDIDESVPTTLPVDEVARYAARKKATAYASLLTPDAILITADTVVIANGEIFGKPINETDAFRMIRALAGKTHRVMTGVTILSSDQCESFDTTTHVTFADLTDEEINHYINIFHPMDKAGAYGIQEWIGYIGVSRIEGCYYNVMGLPVQQLYQALKKF